MFSVAARVNVVVLHYSYTSPEDVNITFAGSRYNPSLRTVVLLKTVNGSHYEAIVSDISNNESIPETEIARLYESFYPERHQHNIRTALLHKHIGGDISQLVNENGRQCGVLFSNEPLPLPVVNGSVHMDWPVVTQDLVYSIPGGAKKLLELLFAVSTKDAELLAYLPRRGLLGTDGLVHALVLNDSRLICRFHGAMDPSTVMQWCDGRVVMVKNLSLKSPFMGIAGTVVTRNSSGRYIALSGGDEVRQCFKRLLCNMIGWIDSSALFGRLNNIELTSLRRESLRIHFVEPVVCAMKNLPISAEVMCAMLTAFVDHHPDHTMWLEQVDRVIDGAVRHPRTQPGKQTPGVISFEKPRDYLKWLVRQP